MAYNDPASEKQLGFLADLFAKRVHSYDSAFVLRSNLSKKQASNLIGILLKAPKKSVVAVAFTSASPSEDPRVTQARERAAALEGRSKGFYALEDEQGTLKFYEIRKAYRREHLELVGLRGAPGYFTRFRVPHAEAMRVLDTLAGDAYEALMRFAEEFEVCGRCAAPLTDALSRERKIGPVCWDALGKAGVLPAHA